MNDKKISLLSLLIFISALFIYACKRPEFMKILIKKEILLKEVPSGSGIEIIGNSIYITGDDSPFLFELDTGYKLISKLLLLDEFINSERIAKPVKPDFESSATDKDNNIYLFGSGGISPQREKLLQIDARDKSIKKYTLTSFYRQISEDQKLDSAELNIEAAVIVKDELFLFNRGNNFIIKCVFPDFINSISKGNKIDYKIYHFNLPEINGIQAGFSGATFISGTNDIVFCSSVENTSNWILDGDIYGSFIGILDAEKMEIKNISRATDKDGSTIKSKIESLSFKEKKENEISVLGIVDNDDGSSTLLEIELIPDDK